MVEDVVGAEVEVKLKWLLKFQLKSPKVEYIVEDDQTPIKEIGTVQALPRFIANLVSTPGSFCSCVCIL